MTSARGRPSGYDSAVISVPARWYLAPGAEQVFLAQVAGRDLRKISERLAASVGERLHHAEWTVTGDPELVKALAVMHHGCVTCESGKDQALAYLRGNPGSEVAAGQLWWA